MKRKGMAMKQKNQALTLSPDELRRLQSTQLELLVEFDRICRKYEIRYILDSGTLLGAVRYKGFIPWDDDLDVGMLRSDYERFCKVCEQEMDKTRFFWQTHETDPGYRWGYGKLLRKNTTFVRQNQEHLTMRQHIFMDVFPYDGVPDNTILRTLHEWSCFILQKLCWSVVGKYHASNPALRLFYGLLSRIPIKAVQKGFRRLASVCDEKDHQWVRVLAYNYFKRISKDYYTEVQQLVFENQMFLAPKDWAGWLTGVYGSDYMTPPPLQNQVGSAFPVELSWGEGVCEPGPGDTNLQ